MVMRRFYSLLILMLLLTPAASLAAQLEAVLDRTRVGLEESFTLELRAKGSVDGEPDLSVLEKDFELLGRSQSSQMQIINTDISRTTTWRLSLLARNAGSKVIPSLCIGSDCSAPIVVEILPAGQTSSAATGESELLLEVSAEPEKVWVQSQLRYQVRLLTRLNFLQASLTEPEPSGVEAVVQKLGEDRNYETERNGLRYRVIERDYAVFPQQSGRLTIPPIRFGAQVAEGGRRGFDPFNQRTRQLRKQSEAMAIEVLPAVEAKGRDWLPASDLQLKDDWQQNPPQLTVGEPATRTIMLRASGLPSAQLPALSIELPDGVRSYPDQPNREDQVSESGLLGILQQKLALVPTRSGTLSLPEITVDWWDLRAERWRQTRLPALELEVLPAVNAPAVLTTPESEQMTSPTTEQQSAPLVTPPTAKPDFWPWLSLVLGSGWLLTLWLFVKSKRVGRNQESAQEPKNAGLSLNQVRRELERAIKSGDQAQVRSALLNWGTTLFPEQRPGNLEELATRCGEPLQQQLAVFSRSLYSRTLAAWDGQELLTTLQQVEREVADRKGRDGLPPLYPR